MLYTLGRLQCYTKPIRLAFDNTLAYLIRVPKSKFYIVATSSDDEKERSDARSNDASERRSDISETSSTSF